MEGGGGWDEMNMMLDFPFDLRVRVSGSHWVERGRWPRLDYSMSLPYEIEPF